MEPHRPEIIRRIIRDYKSREHFHAQGKVVGTFLQKTARFADQGTLRAQDVDAAVFLYYMQGMTVEERKKHAGIGALPEPRADGVATSRSDGTHADALAKQYFGRLDETDKQETIRIATEHPDRAKQYLRLIGRLHDACEFPPSEYLDPDFFLNLRAMTEKHTQQFDQKKGFEL